MTDDTKPTPEDLAVDLLADLARCERYRKVSEFILSRFREEPSGTGYPEFLWDFHAREAAARRALHAEARVKELEAAIDALLAEDARDHGGEMWYAEAVSPLITKLRKVREK